MDESSDKGIIQSNMSTSRAKHYKDITSQQMTLFNQTNCTETHNYNSLLQQLKILSLIQPGMKLMTSNSLQIEYPSLMQSFKRWWHNESRDTNVEFINTILKSTFCLVDSILKQQPEQQNRILLVRILKSLEEAKQGIKNLNSSYLNDANFSSNIKLILENIDIYLKMLISTFSTSNI